MEGKAEMGHEEVDVDGEYDDIVANEPNRMKKR
jgi:hypothetical protein